MNVINQHFCSQPWSLKQGFLFAIFFPFLGFLIELSLKGKHIGLPTFPANLIILLSFISLITILFYIFRKKTWIPFFSSITAAIPAIAVFIGIVLCMGLIPQQSSTPLWIQKIGFNHLLHHSIFYFSFAYLVVILMFTVLKRLVPFHVGNFGFLMNHLGLLIILLAGVFGSSDIFRLKMICMYNQPVWYGSDENGKIFELPLALELKNFDIEYYEAEHLPKKFTSVLKLYTPEINPHNITLEVNKPYYHKGWKLYQLSYDNAKGKWSEYLVIEAVRDPWLPVVYTGIGLLIIGALSMIFQIRKKGNHE